MNKLTTLFLGTALSGFLLNGQLKAQQLFKDLVPGAHPASGAPQQYMNVGSSMYMVTWASGYAPYKLWITDGTAANTTLVKDSITVTNVGDRVNMVASLNGYMYYVVLTDANGFNRELWKTDGTSGGTTLVAPLSYTTTSGWKPQNFITMGNAIYFQYGAAGGHGRELWKTDGTAAGTVEVIDLDPGGGSTPYAGVDNKPMVVYNNKLYFSGTTSLGNYELFSSDGTAAGTTLVQEIQAGTSASSPSNWEINNNELYFAADNGTATHLYKTDGTTITQLSTGINVSFITSFNNTIYFRGNNDLWKSDGTAVGTTQLATNVITSDFTGAVGNYLFFQTGHSVSGPPYYVTDYYRTDGTIAGTIPVPYNLGASASYNVIGNTMYFTRLDSGSYTSVGVWASDGTPAGTSKILNGYGTGPVHIFNNDAFFTNYDAGNGYEPWHLGAPVGIPSAVLETAGTIFPNPSTGIFHIKNTSSVSEVEVYDMMGAKILTVKGSDTIDLQEAAKGVYFVNVKTGKENHIEKIVLQ